VLTAENLQAARRLARRYDIAGMSREDAEQEAVLAMLEAIRDGVADPAHLFNAARTRLSNLARRDAPETLGDQAARVADPEGDRGVREIDDADGYDAAIRPYLDAVTPRQAEILRLTFVEGLDDSMIAERLGKTVRRVQKERSEATQRIRDVAGDKNDPP